LTGGLSLEAGLLEAGSSTLSLAAGSTLGEPEPGSLLPDESESESAELLSDALQPFELSEESQVLLCNAFTHFFFLPYLDHRLGKKKIH